MKKKLTSKTEVAGQKVSASEDGARYVVESEKSGKEAAHKLLRKKKADYTEGDVDQSGSEKRRRRLRLALLTPS